MRVVYIYIFLYLILYLYIYFFILSYISSTIIVIICFYKLQVISGILYITCERCKNLIFLIYVNEYRVC